MKELSANKENIRIDTFLASELDISRSKIQKLIKNDKIKVNDQKVTNNYLVNLNDHITIDHIRYLE